MSLVSGKYYEKVLSKTYLHIYFNYFDKNKIAIIYKIQYNKVIAIFQGGGSYL